MNGSRDGGDRLRIDLLGPVRAWRAGDELALGSAHRRAVLAVLALRANQVVARSELIDAIWGESAPASANGSIYTYVSALRAVLEPDRSRRSAGQVLVSAGSGYCLRLDDDALDLARFDALREQARESQDTAGERAALDAALELWQGDALEGIPGPYADAQRARLDDLRLGVVERHMRLVLNAGGQHAVVDELRQLCDTHPLREGLHGLLMHVLYLTGRRADAIEVFLRLHAATVDSLGTEPGPQLTGLFDDIRRDAPTLRWTREEPARPIPLTAPPPSVPRVLVGREKETTRLRDAAAAVAAGTGGSLWFEGEHGIGTSAVLAAGLAETAGCQLAWHTADELGQLVPLRAMLDCLDVTAKSPDPRRAELAVKETVDGVVELVTALCVDGPLVIVIDHVQWVDSLSLAVLLRLARETTRLPLLLVVASRPVFRRPELTWLRDTFAHTETLAPLADAEVRRLTVELAEEAPDAALLDLARGAAGNPLYVKEIVEGRDLSAIVRHVPRLSEPAREVLRWAALCGDTFTREDLAAALTRPVPALPEVVEEIVTTGLLTDFHGQLSFRHPLVRRALRERHPAVVRAALHRQLAEALAAAGAPVDQVAEQLALAPMAADPWLCDWLSTEIGTLAPRAPRTALRLLRRVITADAVSGDQKETLTAAAARLMFWLGRAPTAEASYVAARTTDPERAAEMRWLLAYLRFRDGDHADAVAEIDQVLRADDVPDSWRHRHDQLLTTFMPEQVRAYAAPGRAALVETALWARRAFRPLRAARVATAPERHDSTDIAHSAVRSYWQGSWDEALTALATPVNDGTAITSYALGTPDSARLGHGVAALIAGHRGSPVEAQAHLAAAARAAGSAPETVLAAARTGGSDPEIMLAATALLAEQRGDIRAAYEVLDTEMSRTWLPWLVRLAVELGEHDRAMAVTSWCEHAAGQDPEAAHCRALVDRDPEPALKAARRYQRTGRLLEYAHAMEDATVLLAERGRTAEAAAAILAPARVYTDLRAGWDLRRAMRRTGHG